MEAGQELHRPGSNLKADGVITVTYSSRRDLNADLLDGLGELLRLDSAVIVQIEVFECFHQYRLFGLGAAGFFGELVLKFSFETGGVSEEGTYLDFK